MEGLKGINKNIDEMIKNRIFNSGTVDAVLQDNAILLNEKNINNFYKIPNIDRYNFKTLKNKRKLLYSNVKLYVNEKDDFYTKINNLLAFTSNLENIFPISHQPNAIFYKNPDEYWWGGTEEMIITKGSDWCSEVARLFCACSQLLEIPSRLVYTFGDNDGHVIAEIFDDNYWVLVDPLFNIIYAKDGKKYNSADIYRNKNIVDLFCGGYYCKSEFFKYIAISEYYINESNKYDYSISYCNDYYRERLKKCWNGNG